MTSVCETEVTSNQKNQLQTKHVLIAFCNTRDVYTKAAVGARDG